MRSKLLVYNIAIFTSFAVFRIFDHMLSSVIQDRNIEFMFVVLSSLGVFNIVFQILKFLDDNYLWKWTTETPNLKGKWRAEYENNGGESYSMIEISQNKDCIKLSGHNFKNGSNKFHSIWYSDDCNIQDNSITYIYTVKAHNGKYQKSGTTILNLPLDKNPSKIVGTFSDNSPHISTGSITFTKVV